MHSNVTLSFRIFKGDQLVREEKLSQNVIKLGKVASAHLRVDDEAVSRMHAIIEVIGHDVHIIDLGSTRGTFVNGQKINKAKLQSGDTIIVGDTRIELGMVVIDATMPAPVAAPVVALVAAPVAAPAMKAAPMVAAPVVARPATLTRPVAATPISFVDMSDEVGGARAVEVAAMLGDSVIGVKHCMDPRSGKVTAGTWAYFATGVVSLLSSAAAFAVSVSTAAANKAGLEEWTHVLHRPAHAFRPQFVSTGYDWLAFGGLAIGLCAVTLGLARMRREKKSPFYRIGTAPGVEMPLEQAPAASFPLVAPAGDDFVFNYGAGMDGELTVDGKSTPLSELVAAGRAHPSASTAGAIEVPIPPKGRIRARAGKTTFVVSAVARPRDQAAAPFGFERRTMAYVAGSLVAHMGVWAFLQTIPVDEASAGIDLASLEPTSIHTVDSAKDDPPPPPPTDGDSGDTGNPNLAKAMKLDEGQAGKPTSDRQDSHMRIKDNQRDPALARLEAMETARRSGFLGSTQVLEDGITSLAADRDFSSGFDSSNVYGALFGAEGEGHGYFGMGRTGIGPGGGCSLPPCGTIGVGNYGTDPRAGDGWGVHGGHGDMRRHVTQTPPLVVGLPTSGAGLDRAIIKRYIKRASAKLTYCYEKQLLAHPGIAGELTVQFFISPNGTVGSSVGQGFDPEVASCVAGVIKDIAFPKTDNGGGVQVNYPFTFHAVGAQ